MKRLLLIVALITAIYFAYDFTSSGAHQRRRVKRYGIERFTREALSYRQTGQLPATLQTTFAPKRTALESRGVFLVFNENAATSEGIYVDPVNAGALNSNDLLSSTTWTPRLAWIKEKKNQTPEYFKHAKSTIETARGLRNPENRRPEIPEE